MSAMGRFKLSGDKEKIRAAARSTKEKTQSSNLKRKGDEVESLHDPIRKRSMTPQGVTIDSSRRSIPSSRIVELPHDKGKEIEGAFDVIRSNSSSVRLTPFFEEIKKSFSRSAPVELTDGSPDIDQKLRMSFDKTASVCATAYSFVYAIFTVYYLTLI